MTIDPATITYQDDEATLTGLLYRDPAAANQAPGLLLLHGGAGLDQHARDQAERWASVGYVVLAADLYGDGVTGDRQRVMDLLHQFREDPSALARRGEAGLSVLLSQRGVTGAAALGYCFGGMAALALARASVPLTAAVSVHGSLRTPEPAQPGAVRASVLVCHGAADPHVPMADVLAFGEEMTAAEADWQVIIYGGAQHGFTHSDAIPNATPGIAYNATADHRSFTAARAFLGEAFHSAPR